MYHHNGDVRELLLALFEDDPDLQMRSDLDADGIEQMAEAMREDKKDFPPAKAFFDPKTKKYYRYDGNRRCRAAQMIGRKSFNFEVREGTRRDAVLAACAANAEHDTNGKGRSSQDKRNAVRRLLSDPDWCKWSDNRIAEHVLVSASFVGKVRKELEQVEGSPAQGAKDEPRMGADGKERKKRTVKHADDNLVVDDPPSDVLAEEPSFGHSDEHNIIPCDVDDSPSEEPFDWTGKITESVSFDVEELQSRKNGAEVVLFDDKKIRDGFKALARLLDDRKEAVGGGSRHTRAQAALAQASKVFEEWVTA